MRQRTRFTGRIVGIGSTSGVRVVVGRWADSPLGAFTDAMVERGDGHRVLLAPNSEVAEFVCATYEFDEVRVEGIDAVVTPRGWRVSADSLTLEVTFGGRMPLGLLLRSAPRTLATAPAFTLITDPVARVALRGVRTRGTARAGRQEFYAATDLHRVTAMRGSFDGADLGDLRPVDPPCTFGFGSTPRAPSVTTLVTTITERHASGDPG